MTKWLKAKLASTTPTRAMLEVEATADDLPNAAFFLVRIRKPRNVRHHRLYWSMLRSVVEATERWATATELHRWIKYELGYFTITEIYHGEFVIEWDSTDFTAMDQSDFKEFFDHATSAIALETGIDPDDLTGEYNHV